MKEILNSKKGFTLVELLAVIVVLAIIVLIAIPSVMNSMDKARRNSFVVEAREVVKSAQTVYSEYLMNGGSGTTICVPYTDVLVKGGYIEKNDTKYHGSVLITIQTSTQEATQTSEATYEGVATYKVWLGNGTYHIESSLDKLTNNSVQAGGTSSEKCGGNVAVLTLANVKSGTAASVPSGN